MTVYSDAVLPPAVVVMAFPCATPMLYQLRFVGSLNYMMALAP